MSPISPIPRDKVPPELAPTYDALAKKFGAVPGFFGVMARRPSVLETFLPLYGAVMSEGTVEPKYKELAYLKTSLVNGCAY